MHVSVARLLFPTMPDAGQMVHVFSDMVDAASDGPPVLSKLDDLSWFVSYLSFTSSYDGTASPHGYHTEKKTHVVWPPGQDGRDS